MSVRTIVAPRGRRVVYISRNALLEFFHGERFIPKHVLPDDVRIVMVSVSAARDGVEVLCESDEWSPVPAGECAPDLHVIVTDRPS